MLMDMTRDVTQYNALMRGSVEDFIIRFESYCNELRSLQKEADEMKRKERWHR